MVVLENSQPMSASQHKGWENFLVTQQQKVTQHSVLEATIIGIKQFNSAGFYRQSRAWLYTTSMFSSQTHRDKTDRSPELSVIPVAPQPEQMHHHSLLLDTGTLISVDLVPRKPLKNFEQDVLRKGGDRFGLLLHLSVVQVRGNGSYILFLEFEGLIQVPKCGYLHLVPLQMGQICQFHTEVSAGRIGFLGSQAVSKQEFRRKLKVQIEGCGVELSCSH